MPVELKVPEVGESIQEVTVGSWRKREGDTAEKDEPVVELESDKATVDLPAPITGVIGKLLKQQGETAAVGEVIGLMLSQEEASVVSKSEVADARSGIGETEVPVKKRPGQTSIGAVQAKDGSRAAVTEKPQPGDAAPPATPHHGPKTGNSPRVMPAAERVLAERGISPGEVTATGPGQRLLKEDVLRHDRRDAAARPALQATSSPAAPQAEIDLRDYDRPAAIADQPHREEEFVVMSPIRRRIAQRLVEAQQTAALLTTFNEADMTEVIALRQKYRETYQQQYGIKLGFMSFFVKAAIDALRQYPQLNAEVREPHIVYRNYYDIGIAVGGGKGLVVPVLRNAEFLSFAQIEQQIADLARRAADNKLKLEELQGGTFTISNGGVYGSMLSTPIVNPPQSGILGLHAIQERPVALNGQVVVRPMMYLALTYDHRIVDGREAVAFLKRIKEAIEDPARMLLEI